MKSHDQPSATLDSELDDGAAEDEGAKKENAEPPCAACQACFEELQHVSAGDRSWDDVPELRNLAEIDDFPGLTKATTGKHIADLDGILAFYDLPETIVPCSLQGAHKHGFGVVVTTLCKLILRMGKDCGKASIIRFKDVLTDVRRRRDFHNEKRSLDGWTDRYQERIRELRGPVQLRADWRDVLRIHLAELSRELEGRRERGADGNRVTVRGPLPRADLPDELKAGAGEDVRYLRGMALFDRDVPSIGELELALARFRFEAEGTPLVSGEIARRLSKLAAKADGLAIAAETWVRETSEFINLDNLRLALIALGRADARVDNLGTNELEISYAGARAALKIR